MGWFDDFFTGDWVGPAVLAGATAIGAITSGNANQRAAETAARASADNAAAIREGNRLAQQRFDESKQIAGPAVAYQQDVINSGGALTPWQREQIEDARRTTTNALSVSGLRGSGRATVAAVKKVEGDLTGRFLADNQGRADRAATGLSNQFFNAQNQSAALDTSTGRAAGASALDAGLYDAGADTANANLRGQAIGDIATLINDQWKEGRKSNYDPSKNKVGESDDNRTRL